MPADPVLFRIAMAAVSNALRRCFNEKTTCKSKWFFVAEKARIELARR